MVKSATVLIPEFEPPARFTPELIASRSRAEENRTEAVAKAEARSRRDVAEAKQKALNRGRFRNLDLRV